MPGIVLSFGLEATENKKLKTLCEMVGLRLRKVLPEEYGQPIGSFAGVTAREEHPEPQKELSGKMLVFAFVSDRQLNVMLSSMKTARIAVGSYKAVLTETNATWNTPTLFAELCKEREELGDTPQ